MKYLIQIERHKSWFKLESLIVVIAALACCSCSSNKDELKTEIRNELLKELSSKREIQPGLGTAFYPEPIFIGNMEYYIQHSRYNCPGIRTGVQRNWHKKWEYCNIFCPVCMNEELMAKFKKIYFPEQRGPVKM